MTYYRDDDEYEREQAYREQVRQVYGMVTHIVEPCSYCERGNVRIGDALAPCGFCAGTGRQVRERQS